MSKSIVVGLVFFAAFALVASGAKKNVLMIAIDDLRVELSPYGYTHMHTPNIQKLADKSMLFERAYVQVALCMPSRTALLVSRRPDTTFDWTIAPNEWFRDCGGPKCAPHQCGPECGMKNGVTLPQYFKEQGYETYGMGKIFHEGADTDYQDYKYSWTNAVGPPTGIPDPGSLVHPPTQHLSHYAFNCSDDQIQDGILANMAVDTIGNFSKSPDSPFFLAVGFHKPHVPWFAPAKYWDFYPNASVDIAPNPFVPEPAAEYALQDVMGGWSHCKTGKYRGDLCKDVAGAIGPGYPYNNHTVPAWKAKQLRQAYWAATSFTDANIGKVLDALEQSPFANNTIIALWGDHGYQLGDNNQWAKQTNFEHATRIPFIIHVPGYKAGITPALVEEVDLFPTLVEAATGNQMPHCPNSTAASQTTAFCTEGFSLLPVLEEANTPWRGAAFSQYNRDGEGVMGYTMRMNTFRFTEWVSFDPKSGLADFSKVYSRELYSHEDSPVPKDFNMEHINLANQSAYAEKIEQFHTILEKCHQRPDTCTSFPPTEQH